MASTNGSNPASTSPPSSNPNGLSIMQWGVQQVASWLRANSLDKHEKTFTENDINGEVLLELNHKILREMNVMTVGDRVRILVAIKGLRKKTLSETTRVSSLPAAPGTPGSPRTRGVPYSSSSAVTKKQVAPVYKRVNGIPQNPRTKNLNSSSPPMSPISPNNHRQRPIDPHDEDSYASSNSGRMMQDYPYTGMKSPVGIPSPRNLPPLPAYGNQARITSRQGQKPPMRKERRPSEEGMAGFYGSLSRTSSNSNTPTSIVGPGSIQPGDSIGLQILPRAGGQVGSRGHLSSPKSPRPQDEAFSHELPSSEPALVTLDSVNKACIRVVGDDGQSRVVTLTDQQARDPNTIVQRVLEKFNLKGYDPTQYGLFLSGGQGGESGARPITEKELLTIVRSPSRPERDKLILRKKHQPPTSDDLKRHREEKYKKAKLENFFGEKIPPTTTARTHNKLQAFFGARPPSELISSNLQDFFPVAKLKQCEEERKRRSRTSSDAGSFHRIAESMAQPAYAAAMTPASAQTGSGRNSRSTSIMSTQSSTFGKELKGERNTDHAQEMDAHRSGSSDDLIDELRAHQAMQAQQQQEFQENREPQDNQGYPTPVQPEPLIRQESIRSRVIPYLSQDLSQTDMQAPQLGSLRRNDSHGNMETPPRFDSPLPNTSQNVADKESTSGALQALTEGAQESSANAAGEQQVSPTALENTPIRWIRGALIGKGSFGLVYLGMNAISGELMAVKRVELPKSEAIREKSKFQLEALEREIAFLKDLDHENIVRYLGSVNDLDFLNIFLEYVPGGSVTALLKNYGAFEEPLVKNFVRQVLLGLNYLHERDIIHRDIKGGNILVDNKGVVKISDFGISKVEDVDMTTLQPGNGNRASLQGSVYWMAPEVVKQMRYTRKADIWSFGCLIIEMFTTSHPWPSFGQVEALFKIGSYAIPEIPENVSEDAKDFLLQTFALDYQERPSAEALLKHAFTLSAPL